MLAARYYIPITVALNWFRAGVGEVGRVKTQHSAVIIHRTNNMQNKSGWIEQFNKMLLAANNLPQNTLRLAQTMVIFNASEHIFNVVLVIFSFHLALFYSWILKMKVCYATCPRWHLCIIWQACPKFTSNASIWLDTWPLMLTTKDMGSLFSSILKACLFC